MSTMTISQVIRWRCRHAVHAAHPARPAAAHRGGPAGAGRGRRAAVRWGLARAGTDRAPAAVGERVTVRPGETLWQIAERVAPGSDPRETVARILDLNGLQTAQVQAGTALRLP